MSDEGLDLENLILELRREKVIERNKVIQEYHGKSTNFRTPQNGYVLYRFPTGIYRWFADKQEDEYIVYSNLNNTWDQQLLGRENIQTQRRNP